MHRALHFGHFAVASALMESGASLTLEDAKGRTPIDLLSGPVSQVVGKDPDSGILLVSSLSFWPEWCYEISYCT